jgi:creatinine amidohydrolase/Fe(II)-dependent formamide hydrolase-like protein
MAAQLDGSLGYVIRQGLRGVHLLFGTDDLIAAGSARRVVQKRTAQELARATIAIATAGSLDDARETIRACSPECRAQLASFYLRLLSRYAAAQGHAN